MGGNLLTALRTAAASAIAIDRLARPEAHVLGIVGAGHQAGFQLRAAARVRRFERVIAWNLHPEMLPKLGAVAAELGLPFEAVDLPRMRRGGGDRHHHLFTRCKPDGRPCQPGHASVLHGTDTRGKQEVEPALVAGASVFTDEVAQSVTHRRGAACRGRRDAGRERHRAAWARC